jgi:leader peptidase (prepilin peptidase)/N-methyltransferase
VIVLLVVAGALGVVVGPVLHNIAIATSTRTPIGTPFGSCRVCGVTRRWPYLACDNEHPGTMRERWWALVFIGVFIGTVSSTGVASEVTAYLVFAGVTLTLVITDIDEKLIPNKVLFPGGAVAIVLLVIEAAVSSRLDRIVPSIAAAAGYYLVFFGVHLLNREGFGMGDVKLAFLLGFFTMFDSLRIFLLSVFFTGFIGGLPAIVLLLTRRVGPKYALPYGPAMVLGAWAAIAFGEPFLSWYLAR